MDSELLKSAWPFFSGESREHLELMGAAVLSLEKDPEHAAQLLETIHRSLHSLKGSASSLGFTSLEELAHAIESALPRSDAEARLSATVADAILHSLKAIEAAIEEGDAGREVVVKELPTLLASLHQVAPSRAADSPSETVTDVARAASAPPGELLQQLWPVFRNDATEQVAALRRGIESTADFSSDRFDDLGRLAHGLQGAAAALGLGELGSRAAKLEKQLGSAQREGVLGPAARESLVKAVEELEHGIAAIDAQAAAPSSSQAAPAIIQVFRAEALAATSALESHIMALCSPDVADRAQRVEDAVRQAHTIKGSASAVGAVNVASIARKLEQGFARMAQPGLEASRAAAALAEEIVQLRESITQLEVKTAPPPSQPEATASVSNATKAEGKSDDAAKRGWGTIRVSGRTLDSFIRQVESQTLTWARREARLRDMRGLSKGIQEIGRQLTTVVTELRLAGVETGVERVESGAVRVRNLQRELARLVEADARELEQLRLASVVMRNDLRDLRTIPASQVLQPLHRTVRDVAGKLGKQVEMVLSGEEVRLDRRILEELKEPLLHLVRNAIDHGIEDAQTRRLAGKPMQGTLQVKVEQRGHRAALIFEDDGGGLKVDKVRAVAVRKGLITEQQSAEMHDRQAARLIFKPGFSTAESVSAISGRGVGLDVVDAALRKLEGTVDVEFAPGKGTRFILDVPLTLSGGLGLLLRVGGERFAIPMDAVARVMRISSQDLGSVAGKMTVEVEGAQVPFASLAQTIGLPRFDEMGDDDRVPALLLVIGRQQVALTVDEVLGQRELVVNRLGKYLEMSPHLSGAAVLEDGSVVPVLDAAELVRLTRPQNKVPPTRATRSRILVTDDSITTRSLMKAILEMAGYDVVTASNGEEALKILRQTPFNMVVSDVQMPRMDGITLTLNIRQNAQLSRIPVVLVTSLDAPEDRAAGLMAGADGYLVKKEVERGKLLELVSQLLPGRE